ncbi:MAG: hypothetical protein ACRCY2_05735 [Bombilactobacillus sp.]
MPTTKAQAQKSRQERIQAPQFLQFNLQYTSVLQAQQGYTGKLVSLSLAR